MSEAYLTNWAMGSHFDDRDRFHDVALRLAVGRPVAGDACDCPAAA